MALAAFDVFTIAQEFEKTGLPKDQAKVIIEAIVSSRANPEVVSHAELREHKAKVNAKVDKVESNVERHESKVLQAIAELRKDTNHAISDLRKDNEIIKRDIIIKLTAVVLGTAGFMLAAAKLLF